MHSTPHPFTACPSPPPPPGPPCPTRPPPPPQLVVPSLHQQLNTTLAPEWHQLHGRLLNPSAFASGHHAAAAARLGTRGSMEGGMAIFDSG